MLGERRANATARILSHFQPGPGRSEPCHHAGVQWPDPFADFTPEEVERARRYHRPLYWSGLADTLVGAAILVVLAFSPVGDALGRALAGVGWPVATMAWVAVVVVSGFVVRLLLSYWRGFF